jgi:hypothetical protein
MLTLLFPNTHTRYTSLPVLGAFLEVFCSWLEAHGYPPSAISRRIETSLSIHRNASAARHPTPHQG